MTPLLEVRGLSKHYGPVRAVDDVGFTLDAGETLALVGESGSGKSTLGRCVLRLVEPTAGVVRLEGRDVLSLRSRGLREFRRQAQIVFQDPYASLNPRMTAGQALAEPLWVHRLCPRAELGRRVTELLSLVGLLRRARRYPHAFSGGQRQRLVIARALSVRPRLLVADEPTSALDTATQAQILDLLRDLQTRLGLAVLFITHNLAIVPGLAHRTAVMYQGRLVESGPTAELFHRPQHPYTQALLAAAARSRPPRSA